MKNVRIEGTSDIEELKVLGEWAWMRNRLSVKMTMPDGTTTQRSGYALTILRKQPDGTCGGDGCRGSKIGVVPGQSRRQTNPN